MLKAPSLSHWTSLSWPIINHPHPHIHADFIIIHVTRKSYWSAPCVWCRFGITCQMIKARNLAMNAWTKTPNQWLEGRYFLHFQCRVSMISNPLFTGESTDGKHLSCVVLFKNDNILRCDSGTLMKNSLNIQMCLSGADYFEMWQCNTLPLAPIILLSQGICWGLLPCWCWHLGQCESMRKHHGELPGYSAQKPWQMHWILAHLSNTGVYKIGILVHM